MDKGRTKISILLIGALFFFGVLMSDTSNSVSADNPNIKTTMSSLTGGWDANFLGPNGKHWTTYGQINVGRKVYAVIRITGRAQEVIVGTNTQSTVKSRYNVGPYVPHTHTGSVVK